MSSEAAANPYTESEYAALLRHERHMFAWTLSHFGGASPEAAAARALERYPFDPANQNGHGLLFHDTAWHWAMVVIHGGVFWELKPQMLLPPEEYHRESQRFLAGDQSGDPPAR